MDLFLELEIAYIVIGVFILSITAFVTSRDFVPRGAFKKGMSVVGAFVIIMIAFHYNMTTSRMINVEKMFNKGDTIICENKMRRTISKSVLLSKEMGWTMDNHLFKHVDYERDFHTSRCVEWIGSKPELAQSKKQK
ncbi:MAG: hypothetical protein COB17_01395 [Sulfurimonas sp.]|nr:MAG: hypothetical protein COB17_01395 [Sulfurimonas sp.]